LVEALLVKYNSTKDRSCLEEAQQALRAAESLNPDSARVRFAGGRVNKVAGQYQKALEDFHRVQVLEPRNIEVLLQIASVYYAADMPEMATDSYHKAIQLDPGYYKSHEQLGAFYYFRGNYSAAAAEFREATYRAPGRPVAYSKLGAALMDLGRYDEAEAALLESLKLRETAAALNNLGATRVYQRRDGEAVEYFERAVKIDPNNYVNIVNLSDVYRRLGRQQQANAACRVAMKLALADLAENPAVGYPRSFVAYCAARLGDSRRAEAEVRQALKSSPGDNKVIESAILTYEVLNQRDKGILALSNATPELLLELERYPDLADFCQDPRFQELVARIRNGGKLHD
jgi:tetratricopeptide (TPR) repeat protein